MGAMLPLVVLGSMVVGGLLIWLGMLGRRINRNPQCTWCRFDLSGVYPGVVTCPECGAGLKRAKAVRMGVRRRMPVVVGLGGVMVVGPMLMIGAVVYSLISGSALNSQKPAWLLMTEARLLGDTHAATVAKELLDRMVTKKASKEDSERAIGLALDIQGDRNRQWSDAWGEIIDRGEVDKVLTDEQRHRYRQQSVRFGLRTRDVLKAGEVLPVFVSGREFRIAPTGTLQYNAWVISVKVNGVECPRRIVKETDYIRYSSAATPWSKFNPVATMFGAGSRSGYGWNATGAETWVGWSHVLPETVEAGPAVVEAELVVEAKNYGAWGGNRMAQIFRSGDEIPKPGKNGAFAVKLTARAEVLDKRVAAVTEIGASEGIDAQMQLRLRPSVLSVQVSEYESGGVGVLGLQLSRGGVVKSYYGSFSLDIKDLPAEVAHDVYVRLPGKKERLIGQVVSDAWVADRGAYVYWYSGQNLTGRSLSMTLSEEEMKKPPKTVDVIYKPRGELVSLAATQRVLYGGTVVVKDVPVSVIDQRGRGGVVTTTEKKEEEKKKEEEEEKEKP